MTENVEGTLTLDGLLQGALTADEDVRDRLREWVDFAAGKKLRFNLELQPGSFDLLPEPDPIDVAGLEGEPEELLRQAIDQFLQQLPEDDRRQAFSTLRTSRFVEGAEVQSIYGVGHTGQIQLQTRTVDAKTVKGARRLSFRERVRVAIIGIVILLAALGVTSIFFDLRGVVNEVIRAGTRTPPEQISVDVGALGEFLQVKELVTGRRGALVLELERTEAYPDTDTRLDEAWNQAKGVRERLAVEQLARQVVSVELLDKDGRTVLRYDQHLPNPGPDGIVRLPVTPPPRTRITQIRLTP